MVGHARSGSGCEAERVQNLFRARRSKVGDSSFRPVCHAVQDFIRNDNNIQFVIARDFGPKQSQELSLRQKV